MDTGSKTFLSKCSDCTCWKYKKIYEMMNQRKKELMKMKQEPVRSEEGRNMAEKLVQLVILNVQLKQKKVYVKYLNMQHELH